MSSRPTNRAAQAIEKLQETSDNLQKQIDRYKTKVEYEISEAKKCLRANNKNAAKMHLRRKAQFEKQMEASERNYFTVQQQIINLENVTATAQTVNAMRQAARAQQQIMRDHNVEKVEDLMEDLQETNANMEEIQTALDTTLGGTAEFDEGIEDELAALEEEELNRDLLRPAEVPSRQPVAAQKKEEVFALPNVPDEPVALELNEGDDELAELMREMAG